MTTDEYARKEGITGAAALYRARKIRGLAKKVKVGPNGKSYRWEFSNGNGNIEIEQVAEHRDAIERIAHAFPELTVGRALSMARILDNKEAK